MSIIEKVRGGAYDPAVPYPEHPEHPEQPFGFQKVRELTAEELTEAATAKAQYDEAMALYREQQKAYMLSQGEGVAQLRADLEAEHGLTDHPKRDLLWEKAWEEGHSTGLSEVAALYEDLAELLS